MKSGASWLLYALVNIVLARRKGCTQDTCPNFLIFHLDDFRIPVHWDEFKPVSTETYLELSTPNLDIVRSEGILFPMSYSSGTMCSPSRFALLTGRLQSRALFAQEKATTSFGVNVEVTNSKIDGEDYVHTLFYQLKAQRGYKTGMFGKWHLTKGHDMSVYCGGEDAFYRDMYEGCVEFLRNSTTFDTIGGLYISNVPYGEGHNPEWIASEAINWIEDRVTSKESFFAYVAPTLTHSPNVEKCLAYSDQGYGTCLKKDTPQSDNWHDDTSNMKKRTDVWKGIPDKFDGSFRENCWAKTAWADDMFGVIYNALGEQKDNTFVVVLNDHGMGSKGGVTEDATRIFQIVRYKGKLSKPEDFEDIPDGHIFNDFILSNADIVPTVLDIAKVKIPSDYYMDGKSWAHDIFPFRSPDPRQHNIAISETGFKRMMVWKEDSSSDRLKYIYNTETGMQVLYNVDEDEHESKNLLSLADCACERAALVAKMREYLVSTCPLQVPQHCNKPSEFTCHGETNKCRFSS